MEEGYHLSEDLADDAIGWLHNHKALQLRAKQVPAHWASGAIRRTGCPEGMGRQIQGQVRRGGWDAYHERVLQRAKEMGWIPADAQLTPRHETMPSWDSIPADERPFQRRLMEVAAGFSEHTDVQGRPSSTRSTGSAAWR